MYRFLLAAALALTTTTAASAATITIGTDQAPVRVGMDNQGWWRPTIANSNATNDNYYISLGQHRNYFTFDLSGLAGNTITGIELRLRRASQLTTTTLSFWDVSTDAASLARRQVVDNAVWSDLGSGNTYGSFTQGTGSFFDTLSFTLNSTAVADANAAIGGYFSIGGRLDAGFPMFGGSSDAGIQEIVVTYEPLAAVPLPASSLLMLTALAGISMMRRRDG